MRSIIESIRPTVMQLFEHLHEHPEVSWQEHKTTDYIAAFLREHGARTQTFDDMTGVMGEIGSGSFTVALRADMDALWQEVDGAFQANHSCGHDAHMTLVLGAFLALQRMEYVPKGRLRLIFQPAEEKGTGALRMVEKQVLNHVDYLYGVHLRPFQEVANGKAAPSILHGASQFITGEIIGQDAHGARPHLGTNAIEVAVSLVNELSKIHLNPMVPHSVKMTRLIAGGESGNIIPGRGQFTLDLRAQTNSAMDELVEKVQKIVETLKILYDAEIRLSVTGRVPAAEINEEAKQIMLESIREVLGPENMVDPLVTSGGEDFHFYTLERPQVKATMLGLGCDLKPGLHHPNMTFDREMLLSGIEILAKTVIKTFERQKTGGDEA